MLIEAKNDLPSRPPPRHTRQRTGMLWRVGVQCQERSADCQRHLVLEQSDAVRLGSRVSRTTVGRTAADDRVGADVRLLHSGELVGLVEAVTKKKNKGCGMAFTSQCIAKKIEEELSRHLSGQSDQIKKKQSTGTEFQEDGFYCGNCPDYTAEEIDTIVRCLE